MHSYPRVYVSPIAPCIVESVFKWAVAHGEPSIGFTATRSQVSDVGYTGWDSASLVKYVRKLSKQYGIDVIIERDHLGRGYGEDIALALLDMDLEADFDSFHIDSLPFMSYFDVLDRLQHRSKRIVIGPGESFDNEVLAKAGRALADHYHIDEMAPPLGPRILVGENSNECLHGIVVELNVHKCPIRIHNTDYLDPYVLRDICQMLKVPVHINIGPEFGVALTTVLRGIITEAESTVWRELVVTSDRWKRWVPDWAPDIIKHKYAGHYFTNMLSAKHDEQIELIYPIIVHRLNQLTKAMK